MYLNKFKGLSILLLCLLSVIIGAITTLGFAPTDYAAFPFIGLIYFIYINKYYKKFALLNSYCFGVGFFGYGLSWIHLSLYKYGHIPLIISLLIVIVFSLYLSLYILFFSYIVKRFKIKSSLVLTSFWILCLWIRGSFLTGFPWLELGYTQIGFYLDKYALLFGQLGVEFVLFYISALIADFIYQLTHKENFRILKTTILFCIVIIFSLFVHSYNPIHKDFKGYNFMLYQPNTSPLLKWNENYIINELESYNNVIKSKANNNIIIFPETAINVPENDITNVLSQWQKFLISKNSELITGSIYIDQNKDIYNSMIVLGNINDPYYLRTSNRYKKVNLVPFGEYIPYIRYFSFVTKFLHMPQYFSKGSENQASLELKNTFITPMICYEVAFGQSVRKRFNPRSKFLVAISDDSWFGSSKGLNQQLQMSRMLTLELGRPMIVDSDTGITAIINYNGKILKEISIEQKAYLKYYLDSSVGKTFYIERGYWIFNLGVVLIIIIDFIFGQKYIFLCKK
ncbi:MAG: apolipoprotein N-acyltransferase [Psittacicella sp.]